MFSFFAKKFSALFAGLTNQKYLSETTIAQAIEQVKEALLEADVPVRLVDAFIDEIRVQVVGSKVTGSVKPGDQFIKIVHDKLVEFLGGTKGADALPFSFQLPATVMVMGLQGSGKTTTIAKLAHYIQNQAKSRGKSRSILVASVDFYRPAAVDQLEILAKRVGVLWYRSPEKDPVQAARDIQQYAKKHYVELLLLDTAGRLHTDEAMLNELRAIDRSLQPRYKMLVLDAMTGQESLNVAQSFEQGVGYHYAILTKLDSDTRAGAAFSFCYAQKKSILFVGSGEKIEDLEQFYPSRVASTMLGMGDVVSLVERTQQRIQESELAAAEKAFASGKITLQDFADQMALVDRMGSLSQIARYLPGVELSSDKIEQGQTDMKRFRAIMSSMTPKERCNHQLLNTSRKTRIARGAGVSLADINRLLERFEETQQYVKLFKKFSRGNRLFR